MNPKNILLVEGEADRALFEMLCKQWSLPVQVKVSTPRAAGHTHDTKQAVFLVLEKIYLGQLADGQIERLAIAVDADSASDGGGFERTVGQLQQHLQPAGYELRAHATPEGLLFAHNDGLKDIGAWVMPNNADEGALEHWIHASLHSNELALMQHAQTAIDQIPNRPKFKPSKRKKAEIATWLAWQTEPDHGLWQAAKPGLLDTQAPQFVALRAWLEQVFAAD